MKKTTPTTLKGEATPEQIATWKKEHKDGVYALVVGGHIHYFREPDRNDVNCALSKADPDAVLDMFEELATLTKLGGSEEIFTNERLYIGAMNKLKVKFEGEKAEILNL